MMYFRDIEPVGFLIWGDQSKDLCVMESTIPLSQAWECLFWITRVGFFFFFFIDEQEDLSM